MKRIWILGLLLLVAACASGGTTETTLHPDLEDGRRIYRSSCALCHGGNGEGATGPALSGVLETFSVCEDHITWITLGSQRHRDEVGPTYGDNEKPVSGVMPSFETTLTPPQIARVAAFERFRFGGATAPDALTGCGV